MKWFSEIVAGQGFQKFGCLYFLHKCKMEIYYKNSQRSVELRLMAKNLTSQSLSFLALFASVAYLPG